MTLSDFHTPGGEKECSGSRAAREAASDENRPSELFHLAYRELEKIAARCLRGQTVEPGILPEALVHEAYLRLATSGEQRRWKSDAHFFAHVSTVMKSVLADKARRRATEKRGGSWSREPLDCEDVPDDCSSGYLDVLDAMEALSLDSRRKAHVFCLRFFYELTFAEIAMAMGLAVATVAEHWAGAREWMKQH